MQKFPGQNKNGTLFHNKNTAEQERLIWTRHWASMKRLICTKY
ncbi:hypothetical protein B4098_2650 [Heyndrickxia coagulans]|uniref:Uncharacterized protein n=1 Tax=Heyndrickxia coagulans TaxID=1398 RepID=A0A150JQL6_HEYCO|nr:hypothetical protein B4098_2650 [Heyndrickxia coagulans]